MPCPTPRFDTILLIKKAFLYRAETMTPQSSTLALSRSIRSVLTRPSPSLRTLATSSFHTTSCTGIPSSLIRSSPSPPLPSRAVLLVNSTRRAPYSTSQRPEAEMSEPTGLIAKSGIELLTFGTPNGYKISILLEELKEAYGKDYTWQSVNISKNTQKEPWFVAAGANGRIPAIVDHDRDGFAVFEGLAILGYLTRRYDPEHKFSFPVDSNEYDEAETWMAWQHGGLGPMQGQANHFLKFAKEKIPYGIQRYVGETERLYGVLDARLEGRQYVVGEKFSIADINLLGWVDCVRFIGIDLETQFPNIHKWHARCFERPGVQRGFTVPFPSTFGNVALAKAIASDPEKKAQDEESAKLVRDAKEKYGYKYASP
ncbi:glutathione S-transferase [Nemania sp. NC0429]|nr:glutathione S-transferase [Nemania sp. NC0429]